MTKIICSKTFRYQLYKFTSLRYKISIDYFATTDKITTIQQLH